METVTFLLSISLSLFLSEIFFLCFKCFLVQCSMPVCIFELYFSTFAGKKGKKKAHSNWQDF